jgi:hypothetical protein
MGSFAPIAAVVGSQIVGSLISSDSAEDAAETQAESADRASQITWDMYEQNRKDALPTIRAGNRARERAEAELEIGPWRGKDKVTVKKGVKLTSDDLAKIKKLNADIKTKEAWLKQYPDSTWASGVQGEINRLKKNLSGIKGKAVTTTTRTPTSAGMGTFKYKASQMYKREKEQGMNAIAKSMNAQGLLGSGALPRSEASYVTGLAGKDYLDAANLWLNTKLNEANIWATTKINPNLALAGAGQVALQNMSNLGASTAENVGQNTMATGNALATGRINSANAWTQGLQNAGNALAGMNWGGVKTTTVPKTTTGGVWT